MMKTGNMTLNNLPTHRACVVKARFPGLKDEVSACGTVLYPSHGIVISHGSIFLEYTLKSAYLASAIQKGQLLTNGDMDGVAFSILLDERHNGYKLQGQSKNNMSVESNICTEHGNLNCNNVNDCKFLGAFRNNDFYSTVCRIMPESSFLFNDSEDENQPSNHNTKTIQESENAPKKNSEMSYQLLSYFIVLKCETLNYCISQDSDLACNVLSIPKLQYQECHIGQTAELISTPFGALCPSVFFNSYSRGVICNVSGRNNCWIITDARCIPGSEGGPLFVKDDVEDDTRYMSGIIASSFCWKNNEWIGFSVACSIGSIHQSILDHAGSNMKIDPHGFTVQQKELESNFSEKERLLSSTVLVQVGSSWGSGVILDRSQGIIITCSHVVKDAEHSTVLVTPYKSLTRYPAKIIFQQKSMKGPYDIAVLQCREASSHLPTDWSLDVLPPSIGQDVSVIGHAVFSTHLSLEPSWTKGVVSKIIFHHAKPVLLQTTCAVHPGVSGGPLFSSDGKLLGIVVCNTKDSSSNTSFPHVNMSVPFIAIWPILRQYLQTGDEDVLTALVLNNSKVAHLWSLGGITQESMSEFVKSKL